MRVGRPEQPRKPSRVYWSIKDPEAQWWWADGWLCGFACGILFVVAASLLAAWLS